MVPMHAKRMAVPFTVRYHSLFSMLRLNAW